MLALVAALVIALRSAVEAGEAVPRCDLQQAAADGVRTHERRGAAAVASGRPAVPLARSGAERAPATERRFARSVAEVRTQACPAVATPIFAGTVPFSCVFSVLVRGRFLTPGNASIFRRAVPQRGFACRRNRDPRACPEHKLPQNELKEGSRPKEEAATAEKNEVFPPGEGSGVMG